jgi:Sec-independent protein translocase protein TatA
MMKALRLIKKFAWALLLVAVLALLIAYLSSRKAAGADVGKAMGAVDDLKKGEANKADEHRENAQQAIDDVKIAAKLLDETRRKLKENGNETVNAIADTWDSWVRKSA